MHVAASVLYREAVSSFKWGIASGEQALPRNDIENGNQPVLGGVV